MDALKLPLQGILVEKPLGHTVASGRRILEAIKAKKLPMVVPHELLAQKTPLEVIRRLKNGEVGKLQLLEIECNQWDAINAGIHWLNFFVRATDGEPMEYVMASFDSSTRTYRDGMQVETTGVTYAQTKSGIRVVMNTGDEVRMTKEGKAFLLRLVGSRGILEFWEYENGYYMLEIIEGAYLSGRTNSKVTFPVDQFVVPKQDTWTPGIPYTGIDGGHDGRKL